jgi:hypothetical protein
MEGAHSPLVVESGSSTPHLGETTAFLSTTWQRQKLNVETHFDVVGEFREKKQVKWVRHQLKKCHLLPLLQLAPDFFYYHYVRFYQNLRFDADFPSVLSSTIDGHEMHVSVADIATALNIPCDDPVDSFGEYPSDVTLQVIIADMCEGEYGDDKRTCIGRSKLPPKLWLIDFVLKRNVCPLGHKTQRIGDTLAALYAFHQKFWVNVPLLIWRKIYKCWDDIIDKRLSNAKTWALPFPCLITKILIEKGVPFLANVVLDYKILIFGLAQWN